MTIIFSLGHDTSKSVTSRAAAMGMLFNTRFMISFPISPRRLGGKGAPHPHVEEYA